jgi:hypothetical protein
MGTRSREKVYRRKEAQSTRSRTLVKRESNSYANFCLDHHCPYVYSATLLFVLYYSWMVLGNTLRCRVFCLSSIFFIFQVIFGLYQKPNFPKFYFFFLFFGSVRVGEEGYTLARSLQALVRIKWIGSEINSLR